MGIKYFFYPYSKKYPAYFKQEKARIQKYLKQPEIEHIGSTSIPDLGGKGIIDIILNVPAEDILRTRKILESKGFVFIESGGNAERLFFRRSVKRGLNNRFIHLHLVKRGSKYWKKALAFRDLLRENKNLQKDYVLLKKEAVKYAKGDAKKYREYKNEFLKLATDKAVKKYNKRPSVI